MFGLKRRGVRRCENDTLLPKFGLLPHTSQTEATGCSSSGEVQTGSRQAYAQPVQEGYPTKRVARDSDPAAACCGLSWRSGDRDKAKARAAGARAARSHVASALAAIRNRWVLVAAWPF